MKAKGASIDYQVGLNGTLVARATLLPAGATWPAGDAPPVWTVSKPSLKVDQSQDATGMSCILTGVAADTGVVPTITGTLGDGTTVSGAGDPVDITVTPTGFAVAESAS
jgi:hypothetical protein